MIETIIFAIYQTFQHYGLLGIFASMFIENIGIPFPIEFGYLAAISFINTHQQSPAVVIVVLTAGHVAGALVAYWIGRRGDLWLHRTVRHRATFEETHRKLTRWYRRYGAITIFATRFIGYVRPWASFVAGFAEFPFKQFLVLTAIGSAIFNVIALYSSWILVAVWRNYTEYHFLIAGAITLLFFGVFIQKFLTRKRS